MFNNKKIEGLELKVKSLKKKLNDCTEEIKDHEATAKRFERAYDSSIRDSIKDMEQLVDLIAVKKVELDSLTERVEETKKHKENIIKDYDKIAESISKKYQNEIEMNVKANVINGIFDKDLIPQAARALGKGASKDDKED